MYLQAARRAFGFGTFCRNSNGFDFSDCALYGSRTKEHIINAACIWDGETYRIKLLANDYMFWCGRIESSTTHTLTLLCVWRMHDGLSQV